MSDQGHHTVPPPSPIDEDGWKLGGYVNWPAWRMECLKQAMLFDLSEPPEDVIAVAKMFADFVLMGQVPAPTERQKEEDDEEFTEDARYQVKAFDEDGNEL